MLQVRLLGQFSIQFGDELIPISSRPVQSLLAYLILRPGFAERREKLAGLLWPESSDESARNNLRHALWRLRKALAIDVLSGHDYIVADDLTICFNPNSDYWLDVADLERQQGDDCPAEDLIAAVSLYRGELLPGFYDEWVSLERDRLRSVYERKMQLLISGLTKECCWSEILHWAEQWIALGQAPEPAYRALMIAHYELGDQANVASVYQRCVETLEQELEVQPSEPTLTLYAQLSRGERERTPPSVVRATTRDETPTEVQPPYKGLQYFDRADTALFFGRERLTARLVARLRRADNPLAGRFLAVIGDSGSGKSSLVRAGLIPALEEGRPLLGDLAPPADSSQWAIHLITPTAHPLEALALSLTRDSESVSAAATLSDDLACEPRCLHLYASKLLYDQARRSGKRQTGHIVIVVDQFEELFTLCNCPDERRAFVDNLLTAVLREGPTIVVIALRADFYAHCARFEQLREALESQQVYIGPMNTEELRRAVTGPAEREGWDFEPGLVDFLLQEVEDEPGALPLLSHALLETWRRRQGRTMTFAGYNASGGVRGAIAATADRVLDALGQEQRAIARQIFLHLTELGEGAPDTRRRVRLSDLQTAAKEPAAVEAVLGILADARLVTITEDSVEVAHEVLIREWPTLHSWLDQNRDDLHLQRQLDAALEEWQAAEQDPSYLLRGTRLDQFDQWAKTVNLTLSQAEQDYLRASAAARQQRLAVEIERQAHERELETRSRGFMTALLLVMVLATIATLILATMARRAERVAESEAAARATLQAIAEAEAEARAIQEALAERQARTATARELTAFASNIHDNNPELAILLALQAVDETFAVDGFVLPEAEFALHQAVQASRLELAITGEEGLSFVAFTPNGKQLVTWGPVGGEPAGYTKIWDAKSGELLQSVPGMPIVGRSLDDNRILIAQPESNTIHHALWDTNAGTLITLVTIDNLPLPQSAALAPDRKRIAYSLPNGKTAIWDLYTGQEVISLASEGRPPDRSLAFSPDGQHLATGDSSGLVTIWDLVNGDPVHQMPAYTGAVTALLYDEAGDRLFTAANNDSLVKVWDTKTAQELANFEARDRAIAGLDLSQDETLLAGSGWDGITYIWDISELPTGDVDGETQALTGHISRVGDVAFSPDGQQVASVSSSTIRIWNIGLEGRWEGPVFVNGPPAEPEALVSIAVSPDGNLLAATNADKKVRVWNTTTGQRLFTLTGHQDEVERVSFSPDGEYLVTVGHDDTIRGWDATTGAALFSLDDINCAENTPYPIRCDIAFSPDERLLAIGESDGSVRLLDFQTLLRNETVDSALVQTIEASAMPVWDMAISPDGLHLATAGLDNMVRLWDIETGERLLTLFGHDDSLLVVVFDHDGRRLATADVNGQVNIWDLPTGKLRHEITGHAGPVTGLAFSPDSHLLASASYDGAAAVWDTETGQLRHAFDGHIGGVTAVAFSPDGKRLYTSSNDGTSRVYLLDIEELMAEAHSRVGRSFTEGECQAFLHLGECPPAP
ncbi:MAG: nSTAND1 domain-containing NTPase [Candidatus Promineifilaceae bacterium]